MGRSGPVIRLHRKQRKQIKKMMRGQKTEYRIKVRATIIWKLAQERLSVSDVAALLNISTKTVRKWRDRFLQSEIHGLEDAPRSGAPPKFEVTQRCEVIAIACDKPENYGLKGQTIWTYDTLTEVANEQIEGLNMSRSSVARTLNENGLRPHKTQMWLHSKDPQFKEKVNDVVGLYHTEWPEGVVVCSIDEKTGMQANERKYETRLPQVGKAGREEYEYIRHGTQSLIASFEVNTGKVYAQCGDHRKAEDLESFMEGLAITYSDSQKIIVIWDNLNIHHDGPSKRWTEFNARHDNKFEFHYTPLHASWVNQVEIFFSILYKCALKHGSFTSVEDLKEKVMAFIQRWNERDGHPFHWTFRGYPMQDKEAA